MPLLLRDRRVDVLDRDPATKSSLIFLSLAGILLKDPHRLFAQPDAFLTPCFRRVARTQRVGQLPRHFRIDGIDLLCEARPRQPVAGV